jgi:hypothetical protein
MLLMIFGLAAQQPAVALAEGDEGVWTVTVGPG